MESIPPKASEEIARGHEFGDLRLGPILIAAAIVVALIVIAHLAGAGSLSWLNGWMIRSDEQGRAVSPVDEAQITAPPEPRLQPEPSHPRQGAQDLSDVRKEEAALLGDQNTGWVDTAHQFRRIPLDRAIDLSVQRGLPLLLPATMPSTQPYVPASARHGPGGSP